MAIIKRAKNMTSIIRGRYTLRAGNSLVKITREKMIFESDKKGVTLNSAKKIIADGQHSKR
jgi:hypothetical protein